MQRIHIKIIPYTSLKSVGEISMSLKFKMAAKVCKKKIPLIYHIVMYNIWFLGGVFEIIRLIFYQQI